LDGQKGISLGKRPMRLTLRKKNLRQGGATQREMKLLRGGLGGFQEKKYKGKLPLKTKGGVKMKSPPKRRASMRKGTW